MEIVPEKWKNPIILKNIKSLKDNLAKVLSLKKNKKLADFTKNIFWKKILQVQIDQRASEMCDFKGIENETPLHLAASSQSQDVINRLLALRSTVKDPKGTDIRKSIENLSNFAKLDNYSVMPYDFGYWDKAGAGKLWKKHSCDIFKEYSGK